MLLNGKPQAVMENYDRSSDNPDWIARHRHQWDFFCAGYTGIPRRYRVVQFLCKGGEGEVYLAWRMPDVAGGVQGARFALKVFTKAPDLDTAADILTAQRNDNLRHHSRHTVKYYCCHRGNILNAAQYATQQNPFDQDHGYLLMQLVPNMDFYGIAEPRLEPSDVARLQGLGVIAQDGDAVFSEEHVRYFSKGLFTALFHMHCNIKNVHNDLDLDNFMLDRYGALLLIDYGRCVRFPRGGAREEEWFMQELDLRMCGKSIAVTGKEESYYSWTPEYLAALWDRGGDISYQQPPLCWQLQSDCRTVNSKLSPSKVDMRLSDVYIGAHQMLRLLLGQTAFNGLMVSRFPVQ
jgi:serine/threonine protein kinase